MGIEKSRLDLSQLLEYNIIFSEEIMAGYSKELLVDVYMHRFMKSEIDIDTLVLLENNASKLYDKVGRDMFRVFANVTPEAIRNYRNAG